MDDLKSQLIGALTDDNFMDPDTLNKVFFLNESGLCYKYNDKIREAYEEAAFDFAERLKKKTAFSKALNKKKRECDKLIKENKWKNNRSKENIQSFSGSEYPNLLCGSWKADDKGVISYGKDESIIRASYIPVTISYICVNKETSDERACIAFKKSGRWKEVVADKSTIASTSQITKLANSGLIVNSDNAKNMIRYLSDIEALNQDIIPRKMSTSKFGWHKFEDKMFFLPFDKEEESNIQFDASDLFKMLYDSVNETKGTFESWQEIVSEIIGSGRIEPRLSLAASLSSVLVEPTGCLPFVCHFYGQTESGKTVCLMLAQSVWANPSQNSGYPGDWNSTLAGLEVKESTLNHLPFLVDDTAKAEKRKNSDFSEIIYIITNGTGKERSNEKLGLRAPHTWRNCTITNGEHPIVKENQQGGAINRVIEVKVGRESIFSDGHRVVEVISENYGHAGRLFVEKVKEMGFEDVKATHKAYYEELLKLGTTTKQAHSAALILTADHIACAIDLYRSDKKVNLITPEQMSNFLRSLNEISEGERCYEYILEQVSMNQTKFTNESTEVWGKYTDYDDGEYKTVCIINSKFASICEEGGFSSEMFVDWAIHNGKITFKDKKRRQTRMTIGSLKPWCRCIKVSD